MSFWEFISFCSMIGGVAITFPYWGPALRRHYARARIENEAENRKLSEEVRADQERTRLLNKRQEELMQLSHRAEIAEAEAKAIRSEALRDGMQTALAEARQAGELAESGRTMLNLPRALPNGKSTPTNTRGVSDDFARYSG